MKEFLLQNWHVFVEIGLLIIVTLLTLFKKKVKIVDMVSQFILSILPDCIIRVEQSDTKGSTNKLQLCKELCLMAVKVAFPDVDVGVYSDFIVTHIEKILATPQKKEI